MKKKTADQRLQERRQLPLPLGPRHSEGLNPRQRGEAVKLLARLLLEAAGAVRTEAGDEMR